MVRDVEKLLVLILSTIISSWGHQEINLQRINTGYTERATFIQQEVNPELLERLSRVIVV
ncbi:hypothetical protein E2C01_083569 [Portunus trituberculatus]|uniref:Uncharacterized protein n=1 Tax=Portunus trituberculatus TaxID=210409 RepID=A0A5B7J2G4_PORTR|nr:hypothetical protein [Portunus trituberculatus]